MASSWRSGGSPALDDYVLVVDDDPDLRETLEVLLTGQGYTVLSASDGREALRLMDMHGPPFLVLLDLMMPGMNGFELRRRMREDPELSDIPVVVLTGAGVQADRRAAELDAEVLRKPLTRNQLFATVARFVKS